ncbi:hypothetical protein [Nostoc sp.]|uniref:hypothetical protein n=1 Tax=Nostoc sp. TaxID=1180 RepID=UPI002FFB3DC8
MDRSLKKAAGSRQQAAEIDGGRITNAMPNAQCPMPNAQYSINFFCKMLKIIASVEKGETESPNLKYVSKVFSHLH